MGVAVNDETKIALVTGASKGVGRGIALGLAGAGWDVAVNYNRDEAGAKATAAAIEEKGQRAWVLSADVGDSADVEKMFDELQNQAGPLDLLVNNAGVQTWSSLLDLDEADWDRTIRTNLKGTFLCTKQAARVMKSNGGGAIVNIGSGRIRFLFPIWSITPHRREALMR